MDFSTSRRLRDDSKRLRAALTIVLTAIPLMAPACSSKRPARVIAPSIGARQRGIASWYGHPYHGRATASGEIYDMERDTAAHRQFIFGTWLRVDNLDNGKRTEVRVNDRGPFVRGRVIDLSQSAARRIEMIGPGTARVRLTVIAAPRASLAAHSKRWSVQVGSFREAALADALVARLLRDGRHAQRQSAPEGWSRVVVMAAGEEESEPAARRLLEQLRKEFPEAVLSQ